MKANEQCLRAVIFITLYKVVLTSESVDKILNVTVPLKANEIKHFRVLLFVCFLYLTNLANFFLSFFNALIPL